MNRKCALIMMKNREIKRISTGHGDGVHCNIDGPFRIQDFGQFIQIESVDNPGNYVTYHGDNFEFQAFTTDHPDGKTSFSEVIKLGNIAVWLT